MLSEKSAVATLSNDAECETDTTDSGRVYSDVGVPSTDLV